MSILSTTKKKQFLITLLSHTTLFLKYIKSNKLANLMDS